MDDYELVSEVRRALTSEGVTDENAAAAIRILVAKERAERGLHLAAIHVMRPQGQAFGELYLDGERFPYYTKDGYHVHIDRNNTPNVTLTIAGETLTVEDARLGPKEEPDE